MIRLLLLLTASLASAQVATQANGGYKTPEGRANVGRILSDPDRDSRQKPRELAEALNLKPGMTVADLGTGVGYMLPWLSKAVGPDGKVIAQDIFPDFVDKAKATAAGLPNVSWVLGNERDTRLPADCCDVVFTLDAYHHFDYPAEVVASIARALRKGGRLVVVDYYKRAGAMANGNALQHIRADIDEVIREIESFGFKVVSKGEHLPGSQWIAHFVRK